MKLLATFPKENVCISGSSSIGEGEQRQDVFFTSQVKMTYSPNPPPIETQHQPEGNTETQNPPPEACTETARRSRTASL